MLSSFGVEVEAAQSTVAKYMCDIPLHVCDLATQDAPWISKWLLSSLAGRVTDSPGRPFRNSEPRGLDVSAFQFADCRWRWMVRRNRRTSVAAALKQTAIGLFESGCSTIPTTCKLSFGQRQPA